MADDRARLARTLTSSLANPYSASALTQNHASAYPRHLPTHHLNPQGYTYSPTYNPLTYPSHPSTSYLSSSNMSSASGSRNTLLPRGAPPTHWYTPGNSKCNYSGCTFTGSANSVQTHMMDRHLIYPPGWHARKRQPDWDTDPSLKGKPIPILGTNVRLDTPEEVAAWITERKRRWPTAARVTEKKRKLEEAMGNGGLLPEHLALTGNKRFRPPPSDAEVTRTRRGRGRGAAFGGGRGRGRGTGSWNRGHGMSGPRGGIASPVPPQTESSSQPMANVADSRPSVPFATAVAMSHSCSDAGSSEDEAPEVMSTKRPPGIEAYGSSSDAELEQPQVDGDHLQPEPIIPCSGPIAVAGTVRATTESVNHPRKVLPSQPKKLPRNPFAAQTSLLRNLLQPEIRVTVSNLSQAIHFLVDNDFLENVELKPGEADEKRIEVVGEQPTQPDAGTSAVDDTARPHPIG